MTLSVQEADDRLSNSSTLAGRKITTDVASIRAIAPNIEKSRVAANPTCGRNRCSAAHTLADRDEALAG
jgi:hypothetical protein